MRLKGYGLREHRRPAQQSGLHEFGRGAFCVSHPLASQATPIRHLLLQIGISGMSTRDSAAAAAAGTAVSPWRLDIEAHTHYMRKQLKEGLELLNTATENAAPESGAATGARKPFMMVQQQYSSLLCGVYWVLCGLALLQPAEEASAAKTQEKEITIQLLSPEESDLLVKGVVLRCLRRHHVPWGVSVCSAAQTSTATTATATESPTVSAAAASTEPAALFGTHVMGFSYSPFNDSVAAALPTCSGLQVLALLNALTSLPLLTLKQLRRFLLLLQRREDGAFASTLPPCFCSSCCCPGAAAAAAGEPWENEGDVRSTFCCLLSLKLIHAAAVAHSCTSAASDAASAAVPAPSFHASTTTALSEAASAASNAPAEPCISSPTFGSLEEFCTYDESWCDFLRDPYSGVRVEEVVTWLLSLQAVDGGVGVCPGAEPHAGAAFCFAGSLALLGRTNKLGRRAKTRLSWWLRERQLPDGCMQGRPGKAGDSCYSFWTTAALLLLGYTPSTQIHPDALAASVAAAQHRTGGMSRVPAPPAPVAAAATGAKCEPSATSSTHSNAQGMADCNTNSSSHPLQFLSAGMFDSAEEQLRHPDPFHTFFALAGLSLLAHNEDTKASLKDNPKQSTGWRESCRKLLQPLDPATALPLGLIKRLLPQAAGMQF